MDRHQAEVEAGYVGMSRASLVDRTASSVIRKVQERLDEAAHETDLSSSLETQLAEVDLAMALIDDMMAGTDGSATLNRIVVDIHSGNGLRHSQHTMFDFHGICLLHIQMLFIIPGGNGTSCHDGAILNCRKILKRDVEGTPEFLNITVSRVYWNHYTLAYALPWHHQPSMHKPGNSHSGKH